MKLLTNAMRERLIANGFAQAAVKGTPQELDLVPVCRLFNPVGAGTWLLTEIQPGEPDVGWGLCDLGVGSPEFGTVSLSELASVRHPFLGLGIERDLYWRPRGPLSLYIAEATKAGRIAEPGEGVPRQRGKGEGTSG